MSETPYNKFYWGDFFGDTMDMDWQEKGAYLLLLGMMWQAQGNDCWLPDDDKKIATMIGCSVPKWRKLKPAIFAKMTINSGFFTQKRVQKELAYRINKSEQMRLNRQGKPLDSNKPPSTDDPTDDKPKSPRKSPPKSSPKSENTIGHSPESTPVGADKPQGPDAELFHFGKQILGSKAGGQITKLKKLCGGDIPATRKMLEQASEKENPGEYVAAMILQGDEQKVRQSSGHWDDRQWEIQIQRYIDDHATWMASVAGPKPGTTGCRAPKALLKKYAAKIEASNKVIKYPKMTDRTDEGGIDFDTGKLH